MVLSPQTIKPKKRVKKNVKRLGRGDSTQKGSYSGRGMKGQRSRSGGKSGLKLKGFKQRLQKVPKLRGFKSIKVKPETVTLARLEEVCKAGDEVTPVFLKEKNVIHDSKRGVKIVATGKLAKSLKCKGCLASKKAALSIEEAGGSLSF